MLTDNQILAVTRRRLQERGLMPETIRNVLVDVGNDLCMLREQEEMERLTLKHRDRRRMTMRLVDRQVQEYARDEASEDTPVYNPEYSTPFPDDQYV